MKIRLLRILSKRNWDKYEIQNWSDVANCKEKPWRICTGPNSALSWHEYAIREEAVNATKMLWHDEAKKYLWKNRRKRKRNKYPW